MTPADTIRPIARLVDQAHPDLKILNTKASCFQLLAMIAKAAGPDFAFVGKTANMDGEGKYTPPGFSPLTLELLRDDGQKQTATITAVSMDALWYLPTLRQVKVIVNSTDGEPGGAGKPARLDCYDIEPFKDGVRQYRWHNPPIAQSLLGVTPDAPPTHQPPLEPGTYGTSKPPAYPSYEALGGDEGGKKITRMLEADYKRAGLRGLDGDCGAWQQRVSYDFLTGVCKTVEEAIVKHRKEWCDTLGIDVA